MKIKTISYGKTYSLGNFSSERIDLQADIDETEDENKALLSLKQAVERFHKENNQHLYANLDEVHVSSQWVGQPTKEEENLSPAQKIIRQIEQCSDKKVLETFRILANNNPEVKEAYDKKMQEFLK